MLLTYFTELNNCTPYTAFSIDEMYVSVTASQPVSTQVQISTTPSRSSIKLSISPAPSSLPCSAPDLAPSPSPFPVITSSPPAVEKSSKTHVVPAAYSVEAKVGSGGFLSVASGFVLSASNKKCSGITPSNSAEIKYYNLLQGCAVVELIAVYD